MAAILDMADRSIQTQNCQSCHFEDGNVLQPGVCLQPNGMLLLYTMIESMIQSQCRIADPCRRVRAPRNSEGYGPDSEIYDFVVVGGGVAGSVVASRLTENENYNVLLLEAGREQPTVTSVPVFQLNASDTSYDWQYVTTPQEGAFLSTGGVSNWPRGKMLCGSGCVGAFAYSRGSPGIYNDWGKNNPGWSYDEVLYYFKKSENNTEPPNLIDRKYHGFKGPLPIGRYPYNPATSATVLEAFRELGYREGDINSPTLKSVFTYVPAMIRDGVLISTERAFLRPHLRRPNLRVLIQALATRIVFDASGTRATGVEFRDKQRKLHRVRVSKEVIVCGGVVGSPQLLQLSGVGPRQLLQRLGIPVVRDLPVGGNLNRHVSFSVNVTFADRNNNTLTNSSLQQYFKTGTGPFSSYALNGITVFAATKYVDNPDVPDVQFYFDGYPSVCEDCRGLAQPGYVNFRPSYTTSTCRGTIQLKSADPYDKPLIDPNYLCNEKEVLVLYETVKLVRNVTQTKAFRPKLLQFDVAENKNCAHLRKKNDPTNKRYWTCVIRQYTRGENHHGGTCKMGPVSDPAAVVDNQLRVHGINNVRVIDASICPSQPNTNNLAAALMIAEKGSDEIKSTYGRNRG